MEQVELSVPGPEMPPGRPLSDRDLAAQARVFGGLVPDEDDAIALRDARGHRFQRLEWLGDAILNLLAAEHWAYAEALGLECCVGDHFETSDRTLGRRALETDVAALADWSLAWRRAADVAEAAVGAAFRTHGWSGARRCAAVLHVALGTEPTRDVPLVVGRRSACALGAQVYDTTVSIDLFLERPDLQEGMLSALRTRRITNHVRAGIAEYADLRQSASSAESIADNLDQALGNICLKDGIVTAITTTRELIRSHTLAD